MAGPGTNPRRIPGGAIEWLAEGQARGCLGLLHGLSSAATTWWGVAPLLNAAGWDVIALDLPGHGNGPELKLSGSPLQALADDVGVRLPAHLRLLVGHSMGAIVAASIVAAGPGRADGLVLVEPPSMEGIDTELFAQGVEGEAQALKEDPGAVLQKLRADHPAWDGDELGRAWDARRSWDATGTAAALRSNLTWDLPGMVGAAARYGPVLVIVAPLSETPWMFGGSSALMGAERDAVANLLPPERFVVMGTGHSLQREQPGGVAELIAGFAAQLA